MARAISTNPPITRNRVEAETDTNSTSNSLKRAKDGSAFTRCEENEVEVLMPFGRIRSRVYTCYESDSVFFPIRKDQKFHKENEFQLICG
ncbi:hypothetical protein IFM89_027996 [Coptis chinensis]|uniref:Uncharacterized protein n=1 Tax=Coptis chinensis TaxID=261450 RepID=A0A835LJL4_9MAGN|nr:hypothetical protein IFM89_027996 [Coptis chinensis]